MTRCPTGVLSPVAGCTEDMRCDEDGKYIDPSRMPVEGEPDFIETNCHWKDCSNEYDTQDELVRVGVL